MNVLTKIEQVAEQLQAAGVVFGHGTTNAFDEAAWLVLWRLGLPLDADLATPGHAGMRALPPAEQQAIDTLVAERIHSRRPAAYLTGEAWLQGVPFTVDERVIVPRSLIAELIADGTLDAWLNAHTHQVLDLCTGGGSLAVLAALAWPEVQVTATDLSADALAVARLNVERHGLGERITLAQGDGLAALKAGQRFDLVLCNPPYVNRAAMATLPPEYRAEPALALDGNAKGGSDGMDFIRQLLPALRPNLNPGAVLVLEIGHERDHFLAAFKRLPVVWLPTSGGDEQVLLIEAAALA
jgi:ribosomal protein L3 glutamine methyltransferase